MEAELEGCKVIRLWVRRGSSKRVDNSRGFQRISIGMSRVRIKISMGMSIIDILLIKVLLMKKRKGKQRSSLWSLKGNRENIMNK